MSNGRSGSGPNGPTGTGRTRPGFTDRKLPALPRRRVRRPIRPRKPKVTGNLFDQGRRGDAVVRPEDLLALRIERRNLEIVPGSPPRLVKSGNGASYLILHFPPQAITERTFFEAAAPGTTNPEANHPNRNVEPKPEPGGSESPTGPPIRARTAGESRIAFQVPNDFDIPYTLSSVLDACQELALRVPRNARPPARRRIVAGIDRLLRTGSLRGLTPARRAALATYIARSMRIATLPGGEATLRVRQFSAGPELKPLPSRKIIRTRDISRLARPPRPGLPSSLETAIELPWRLIVSPHAEESWRHASTPVTSPATGHTELWHSRLVAPDKDGNVIEPPSPDPRRTIRAVWALTGEGSAKRMQKAWPDTADLPGHDTRPFRMPLDDRDRFEFVHLSSNFSVSGYTPEPVATELLMLSALGGWLDSRGAWDPPGLSVEEWVHRASMARDHYVRVVYRGFLYPFGHRVSLVKVSERKFHNGKQTVEQRSGNPAYLRQRLFIVIRERERRFDRAIYNTLRDSANTRRFARQLPFSSVRILTQVTPNLDQPNSQVSLIGGFGQSMFWPAVNGTPFAFQCVASDLDGRRVAFELPMIFMDNTMGCPRIQNPTTLKLDPNWSAAETNAVLARDEFAARQDPGTPGRRFAALKQQRVALATSLKPGDTTVQADTIEFGGEVESGNASLRIASEDLSRPVFFPKIASVEARIGALSHLTGSSKNNKLTWNTYYLQHGFDGSGANKGEVFVSVADQPNMAMLDFSAQGDRSGGFLQPNLKPSALSRLAGPVMGDVGEFIQGNIPTGGGFPKGDQFPSSIGDLPLPLLFGCIPLGELIASVTKLDKNPDRVPKFVSEASTRLEDFINTLGRLYGFATQIAAQSGNVGAGAIAAFASTQADLLQQASAYATAQVAPVQAAANLVTAAINDVVTKVAAFKDLPIDVASTATELADLPASVAGARSTIAALITATNTPVAGVQLPSGFRQSLLSYAQQVDGFLADLEKLPALIGHAKTLFDALDDIVGQPDQIASLFSDPDELRTRVLALAAAIDPLRSALEDFQLLDGAPARVVLAALSAVEQILGSVADLLKLVDMLTGDELTIRFDWNPAIDSWWLPGANPASDDPIFRANDKRGLLVAVEAMVKKSGSSSPKVSVVCGLKQFDLVLIAPASFLELNFEKIEFRIDSAAKMDVDVLLSDIKFVGPLSFVETLRDLIPLDGFSDPPYLDISAKGIDAGFNVGLPSVSIGVLSLNNLSLGAGFTVPFIGQPLSVRFNFCTREQPFNLTVYMFGGGGFFGVTIDPHGVQILEASFEFGASLSVDFGVASGGVHVMAGIYFRMEMDDASLTGYFRLGGHVDVLGLITASLELYLELRYEFESGKCVGKAQLTIEISLFIFSGSVTITCERKFAGSNGDPVLRDMVGLRPDLTLEQELALIGEGTRYAWREYCEAFA